MTGNSGESRQQLANALTAVQATFEPGRPVVPTPETPPQPSAVASGDKNDLVSAFDRLVAYEAEKPRQSAPPPARPWKRFLQPAVIAGCVATIGYLLIARPAWLYPRLDVTVSTPPNVSAPQLMTAASILIDQYVARTGRLPGSLEEVGLPWPGMTLFDAGNGGYRVAAVTGSTTYMMTAGPGRPFALRKETR